LCLPTWAQDSERIIDTQAIIDAARSPSPRELTVLAPTLSPAEIDLAVLNRLMQEIVKAPDSVMTEFRIDSGTLQDILISLSNARTFINTNEMANVRSMCDTFNKSQVSGTEKIAEALAAYERRSSYTKQFIASFYNRLVLEIEAGLSPQSLVSFKAYMNDRRRRMATAGNVTTGIPTQNVTSGREAVEFHCGTAR
jgi:hypothetical protein